MPKPVLIINGKDYAPLVLELKPAANGLDADGSGRDTQTAEMVRTKIADKMTLEVSMDRIYEDEQAELSRTLKEPFYQATVLDPDTNTPVTKTFYTSARPFGSQRYDKRRKQTYYDGMAFKMIEK